MLGHSDLKAVGFSADLDETSHVKGKDQFTNRSLSHRGRVGFILHRIQQLLRGACQFIAGEGTRPCLFQRGERLCVRGT